AEQYLPASGSSGSEEALPSRAIRPISPALHEDKTEISAAFPFSSAATGTTESLATSFVQEPAPVSLQSLERTHELMSLHAVQLKESGNDSMQVVIKPGPSLQLSLNLQMRNGNVEMRALLQHGDFDLLSRHWPELQQQLESRGVRLGPLVPDSNL